MTEPFDIMELRANIGVEPEIERMLLSTFMESCQQSLDWLRAEFPSGDNEAYNLAWKKHMHQIKGAAMNINAHALREAAKEGQDNYQKPLADRKPLLAHVTAAFDEVRNFIKQNGLA